MSIGASSSRRPETKGHVANTASGGAPVSSLAAQAAQAALDRVPTPELMIVQTIDNDIRCDGTDADNGRTFGDSLQQALKSINAAAPQSKILLVGQLGPPNAAFISQLVAADPSVKDSWSGPGSATSTTSRASSTRTASPH